MDHYPSVKKYMGILKKNSSADHTVILAEKAKYWEETLNMENKIYLAIQLTCMLLLVGKS